MPTLKLVEYYLVARVEREGDWYVSHCVALPVSSQGETAAEAMGNLIEATQLFLETCVARGTLDQVLRKHKWRPASRPPQRMQKGTFALPVPIDPALAASLLECRQ